MHIALLTLKETIEGEMNGETVEIGLRGARRDLHVRLMSNIQVLSERLRIIYLGMKVSKEQSDLGFEDWAKRYARPLAQHHLQSNQDIS